MVCGCITQNAHWDCKGHRGAALFLGRGAVSSYSIKLKSSARSSTESEIVVVDRYMPQMLWSLYFAREQGYDIKNIKLHQDNISAQLLERNGKFSSSSKTKHIKAKIFFVKDKVNDGDVVINDCPTEVVWADILTKPLQGKAFREMRAVLMNCPVDYIDELDVRSQQRGIEKSAGVAPKKVGAKREKSASRTRANAPLQLSCAGVCWAGLAGHKAGLVGPKG